MELYLFMVYIKGRDWLRPAEEKILRQVNSGIILDAHASIATLQEIIF
jgi:hypothetical protein